MKLRENPLDVAVTRFVADFVAIIERHVARAIDEALAVAPARKGAERRRRTPAKAAAAKVGRRGGVKRTAAPATKKRRARASKVSNRRAEQLSLF